MPAVGTPHFAPQGEVLIFELPPVGGSPCQGGVMERLGLSLSYLLQVVLSFMPCGGMRRQFSGFVIFLEEIVPYIAVDLVCLGRDDAGLC